jgi:septation ring formation regulator EzrA
VIISLRNSDKRLDRALDTKAIVDQNKDLLKSLEAISDSLKVKYDEAVLNDQKASASYDTAFKNNTLPKPEIRELKQAWDEAEKNVKDIKKQIEDNNIKISSVQGVLKKNSDKLKEQENSFEEVWNKLHKLKAPSGE